MSCKTRQKSQEIQCERIVEVDTCGVSRMDYRDLSVTDIVIEEYGNGDGSDIRPAGQISEPSPFPIRITRIHRQNDITTQMNDSITKTEKREENTHVIQQNKSSPDKSSHAIFSVTTITIILMIILVVMIFVRFTVNR